MRKQMEYWRQEHETTDDYHLDETLDYRIPKEAEEEFLPFGLDGVEYKNIRDERHSIPDISGS